MYTNKRRERIVEFFDALSGNGGLISFFRANDGTLAIHLYALDRGVRVTIEGPRKAKP